MNRNKFKAGTAFQDMLFLMLSGVTVLWVLSFLLINPIAKQHDIETPAEYIITMDWAGQSDDDIDMWLRTPNGNIIGFFNKDQDGANLERDDLGLVTDCYQLGDGANRTQGCIRINREVITLRGLIPGEYQLKFHVYNVSGTVDGNPVEMEIIKINPYKIVFTEEFVYEVKKQHISVIRFTIDADGNISELSQVPVEFSRPKAEARPNPNQRIGI
tara:strand:+ start:474 stop:1118 length:645 start_codon:yes stop_codon:yes gene_type:complete